VRGRFVRGSGASERVSRPQMTEKPQARPPNSECGFERAKGHSGAQQLRVPLRANPTLWIAMRDAPPRSVHAVLPRTALRRSSPSAFSLAPWPVWSWRDDGSVEVDQSHRVWWNVAPPAVPAAAFVALRHKTAHAHKRMEPDLVEGVGGVSITEVAPSRGRKRLTSCAISSTPPAGQRYDRRMND
jgi:hypothetical protein